MPTENERKFVLSMSQAEVELEELKTRNRYETICQGYLSSKCEKTTCRVRYSLPHEGEPRYKLTVKRPVGGRVIEVETPLEIRDFEDLWSVAKRKLTKVRVYIEDWEVDFFLGPDDGKVYFVLAEHEMPEGQQDPSRFTAFVEDRLLFEVPRGDDRFSNKRLGKVKYAKKLLSSLRKEANV